MREFVEALGDLIELADGPASLARQAAVSPALLSGYVSQKLSGSHPSLRTVLKLAITSARLNNTKIEEEVNRWLKFTGFESVPQTKLAQLISKQKEHLRVARRDQIGKVRDWENSSFSKDLALELEELVKRCGGRLKDVSKRTGIAPSLLWSYVNRKSRPSQEKAVALANLDAKINKLDRAKSLSKWLNLCRRNVPDVSILSGLASEESPLLHHELRQQMEDVLAPLFSIQPPDTNLFNDLAFTRMSQYNAIRRIEEWQKRNFKGSVVGVLDYVSAENLRETLQEAELEKHLISLLRGPNDPSRHREHYDIRCRLLIGGPKALGDQIQIASIFRSVTDLWNIPNLNEKFEVRIQEHELYLADRWLFTGIHSLDHCPDPRGCTIIPVSNLKAQLDRWGADPDYPVFSKSQDRLLWSSAVIEMSETHVQELMKATGLIKKGSSLEFDPNSGRKPWLLVFPCNS